MAAGWPPARTRITHLGGNDMARSCSVTELESFVRANLPGMSLVYFVADPVTGSLAARLGQEPGQTLRSVVNRLRQLANKGMIDFVQRRDGQMLFYMAIWRARPAPLSTNYLFEMVA